MTIADRSLTQPDGYAIIATASCLYFLAELQWCCRTPLPDTLVLDYAGTIGLACRCADHPYSAGYLRRAGGREKSWDMDARCSALSSPTP